MIFMFSKKKKKKKKIMIFMGIRKSYDWDLRHACVIITSHISGVESPYSSRGKKRRLISEVEVT